MNKKTRIRLCDYSGKCSKGYTPREKIMGVTKMISQYTVRIRYDQMTLKHAQSSKYCSGIYQPLRTS
jgi:hypothetical protein